MQEEVEDALDRKDSTGRFAHGPRTLLSGLPRKKGFRRPKFRRYSTNARLLQGWLTKDPLLRCPCRERDCVIETLPVRLECGFGDIEMLV
jgi:hypothetical protein